MKQYVMILFVLLLALSVVSFAQDTKKEMKKDDKMSMTKDESKVGPLKSITCDPACGFAVKSHDEAELMSMGKAHAKKHHNKAYSDKEMKAMMKTEDGMDMKK